MEKSYKPTTAMKNNSLRGLVLLNKSKSLASSDYRQRVEQYAEILKKESVSLEELKSLYAFLTKAEEKYKPNKRIEKGAVDFDTASFLAAGGSSALAYCRLVLKQEGILKSYKKDISEEEINQENQLRDISIPVTKAVNEELKQATFIVMIPDEVDLHGDVTTEDEVRKACHNFNKFCMKANLFHLVETDSFEFAESYIAPTDFILGDKFVKKGTWLTTIQALDDKLWALIKSGEINGVSIGALASVEPIQEED